jgi:hypothetical protein
MIVLYAETSERHQHPAESRKLKLHITLLHWELELSSIKPIISCFSVHIP